MHAKPCHSVLKYTIEATVAAVEALAYAIDHATYPCCEAGCQVEEFKLQAARSSVQHKDLASFL